MPTNVSFDKRETSVYQANVFLSLTELGKQRLAVQRVRGAKHKKPVLYSPRHFYDKGRPNYLHSTILLHSPMPIRDSSNFPFDHF